MMDTNIPRSARTGPQARRATCLVAAAILAFSPGLAAARCATEAEQVAFEVEALKTELMVVATTCKGTNEDRYNDFVRRYQPSLVQANRSVGQFFTKVHGRSGTRQNDFFITELANARSNQARQLGSDFCSRNSGLFDEVMSLSGAADLAPYAATKDLLSSGVTACAGASGGTTTAAAAPARRPAASKPK